MKIRNMILLLLSVPLSALAQDRDSIEYRINVQRATQAAIWAMPAAGMIDILKATRNELDGDVNQVVYFSKPMDSKHGFLTANDVTAYAIGSLSIADGPLVFEVPAATDKVSYFGSFVNQWDQPIEDIGPAGADKGKGGKYLFVPPGYEGKVPAGYLVYHPDTYGVYFAFRPVVADGTTAQDVTDYAKSMRIYYLKDAANPPATTFIDAYPKYFNTLPTYDHTFFEDINDAVQDNPIRPQDKVMISLLKGLGIEKGQPFEPTAEQKAAMKEGLALAYDSMQSYFTTPGKAMIPLWPGKSQWQVWNFAPGQPQAGFPYETDEAVLVDERAGGSYFWITFLPRYLGGGTFYLTGIRDQDEHLFDGKSTYRLNVPQDTPARAFWSVIVYSMESKGFVRDAPIVGLSSRNNRETMKAQPDGSIDIYFAPEAPPGQEQNWIPTGEDFFLLFRLYGPASKDFYKRWSLGDVVKIK